MTNNEPRDINRILSGIGRLETRLKEIEDHRLQRIETNNESKRVRREQMMQDLDGQSPTDSEIANDDISANIKASKDDIRRNAAIDSLMAVVEFLNCIPEWQGLDHSLDDLQRALSNVDFGRHVDWLKPSKDGRPPQQFEIEVMRGAVAAVMEILIRSGYGREDAARFIERNMTAIGQLLPEGTNSLTWRQIAEWRDHRGDGPRKTGYDLTLLVPDNGAPPEQFAKSLLTMIAGWAAVSLG